MRRYTETHEWVQIQGELATIGLTQHGIKEIGEIVYIEFPHVGKTIERGQDACVVESTKAAIDIVAPISGEIVAIHSQLKGQIEKLNTSPENEGWLFQVRVKDKKEFDELLDKSSYESIIGGSIP
jgi:glycine cleavage system H protein